MKYEKTMFSNIYIVVDEFNNPIAIQRDGKIEFQLQDYVKITSDHMGYITPGIKTEGEGEIVEIRRDDTDHFYGVLTNNKEFGYVKSSRLTLIKRKYNREEEFKKSR